jgi:hypothetical protein
MVGKLCQEFRCDECDYAFGKSTWASEIGNAVEIASSELWNLGCNSVLLREAVMARLLHFLHELLLFSCMAAFAIGVVIAAASIFG